MKSFRIGTRGSRLALAQTAWVKEKLEEKYPDARIETILIKTSGDRFFEASVQSIGGKGIFTKEIEDALLRHEIDIAVHSMKDLPTELPAGLIVAAIPQREDPRDVLVSAGAKKLTELSTGAKIGTGSLRRTAQLLYYRRDLAIVPIRGNVDTRLQEARSGRVRRTGHGSCRVETDRSGRKDRRIHLERRLSQRRGTRGIGFGITGRRLDS